MNITNVRATRYMDPEMQSAGKGGYEVLVCEVNTDEGITGMSYLSYGAPPNGSIGEIYMLLLTRNFRHLITGMDAGAPKKVWDLLYNNSTRWGRRGIPLHCISLIDTALWDIKAKKAGVPVYKLLGGPVRDRIPCYANTAHHLPPDELAEKAASYVKEGFNALKIRGNAMLVGTDEATARLKAVREAVGPDIRIMVDVNGTWDRETAVRMLRLWEPYDVYWLEEPVHPDDIPGFIEVREVARQAGTLVAAGEQHGTLNDFRQLIESGCVDVVQPDSACCGGITEFLHISAFAKQRSIPVSPHILQHVHLHLAAALPETMWVEYFLEDNPMMRFTLQLIPGPAEALRHREGMLDLPTAPGFGLELDPEIAERSMIME